MEDKQNSAVHMYLHGAKLLMTIDLSPYNAGPDQYRIKLFDSDKKEYAYSGNLQETIELILLSKLHKAQLQTMDKKEPIVAPKCDLCPNPAEWFESPLGNPDEPKMCNSCYHKHVEPGARDWDAHYIPLKCEVEIRELQNNG